MLFYVPQTTEYYLQKNSGYYDATSEVRMVAVLVLIDDSKSNSRKVEWSAVTCSYLLPLIKSYKTTSDKLNFVSMYESINHDIPNVDVKWPVFLLRGAAHAQIFTQACLCRHIWIRHLYSEQN
jgi:hypothetical protein